MSTLDFWQRADVLIGSGFLRDRGSLQEGLDMPSAASLASSSASLLGVNFEWPGTQ